MPSFCLICLNACKLACKAACKPVSTISCMKESTCMSTSARDTLASTFLKLGEISRSRVGRMLPCADAEKVGKRMRNGHRARVQYLPCIGAGKYRVQVQGLPCRGTDCGHKVPCESAGIGTKK